MSSKITVDQAVSLFQSFVALAEVGKAYLERKGDTPDAMTPDEIRTRARQLQSRIQPWDDDDGSGDGELGADGVK